MAPISKLIGDKALRRGDLLTLDYKHPNRDMMYSHYVDSIHNVDLANSKLTIKFPSDRSPAEAEGCVISMTATAIVEACITHSKGPWDEAFIIAEDAALGSLTVWRSLGTLWDMKGIPAPNNKGKICRSKSTKATPDE